MTRKYCLVFLLLIFLSGCARYQYKYGEKPYEKGYVISRDGYTIPEYTIGKEKSVPAEKKLAEQRFKRRRRAVEGYYAKMGLVQSRLKDYWDFPVMIGKTFTGFFRLPFIAYDDYKYDHDPKYRAKIDKENEVKDALEEERMNKLKAALSSYIVKDLAAEPAEKTQAQPEVKPEPVPEAKPEITPKPKPEAPPLINMNKPVKKPKPQPRKARQIKKEAILSEIKAVIIAKPVKGYSPLRVNFQGAKSHSRGAKIIWYSWDFGDGDKSSKANPRNTFYSSSVEPRHFTVTLTVQDSKGNSAAAEADIEVLNK